MSLAGTGPGSYLRVPVPLSGTTEPIAYGARTPGLMINLAPASSDALIRLRGEDPARRTGAESVSAHGAAVTYDERMATPETIVRRTATVWRTPC